MESIILALISAILLGFYIVLIKMGMHRSPQPLNAIITFSTAASVMWLFVIFFDSEMPSLASTLLFTAAGIMAPGIAAILNFEGVRRAGVSITSSFIATSPFFSTLIAVFMLKEKINFEIASGTMLIIGGIVLLSWLRSKTHVKLTDLLFPAIAAALIGIASAISKYSLNISSVPFSGIAIAVTSGVIFQLAYTTIMKKWNSISKKFHEIKYFAIAGLFAGPGMVSLFLAMSKSNLVVVFPIANTQPLFAILFSWLLFREHDHITVHTIIGAAAIVAGAALVSIGA